jgi:hypothetical protein
VHKVNRFFKIEYYVFILIRACLANQVGGKEAAEKPLLEERRCTSEANEKMVLEPLAYSSDTRKNVVFREKNQRLLLRMICVQVQLSV